jgi:soluble lytic murein transglycosylase-like protein
MSTRALWWLLGLGIGALIFLGGGGVAMLTGWKKAGSAANWLPFLAEAESYYHIPTDLLARMAYQESHFREDVIRGTTASPAGAMGILQLMPAYFPVVNTATPYSDSNVEDQISAAAAYLSRLYHQFGSWTLALAAYNAGPGTVAHYGNTVPPIAETQNYVSQVLADVPAATV